MISLKYKILMGGFAVILFQIYFLRVGKALRTKTTTRLTLKKMCKTFLKIDYNGQIFYFPFLKNHFINDKNFLFWRST